MANISEARGSFMLDGEWTREQIKNILYVLYSQDTSYDYSMRIDNDTLTRHIDTLIKGQLLNFSGTGRWSFTSNLESFHDWTDLSEEHYKYTYLYDLGVSYDEYVQRRKSIMLDMVKHKLSLNLFYADIETGCDMAYTIDVVIAAEYYYDTVEKSSLVQFVTKTGQEEAYDCNMKFLCDHIYQDTEPLDNFIYELVNFKGIKFRNESTKDMILDTVIRQITKHDDWMNIPAYPDVTQPAFTEIVDMIESEIKKLEMEVA